MAEVAENNADPEPDIITADKEPDFDEEEPSQGEFQPPAEETIVKFEPEDAVPKPVPPPSPDSQEEHVEQVPEEEVSYD